MSFLNLAALWIAAGVVPTLLILYFLKLRRREEPVPSTLLWKRAVQDLQVNAPFQKLRKNLLLLLQFLILAAGVIALARPIVEGTQTYEGRVVFLIDRSASMNAIEADGRTRLQIAKEQAIRRARTFNARGSNWLTWAGIQPKTQLMVIAFDDTASVLQPFTTTVADVVATLEGVTPTDSPSDLSEALQLAQAYSAPPSMYTSEMEELSAAPDSPKLDLQNTPVPAEQPATLILFSDGAVGDASGATLRGAGLVEWVPIGEAADNVGITALRTRRDYENPDLLLAFVELRNFGPTAVTTDVSIYLDGQLIDAKAVTLDAGGQPRGEAEGGDPTTAPAAAPVRASVTSLTFERPVLTAGQLEARVSRKDALPADNTAYAVIPAPRKMSVLLVTERNWALEQVLGELPLERVDTVKPAAFDAAPAGQFEVDGQSRYDVVVLDKHAPAKLPIGNYLVFGAAPEIPGMRAAGARDDYRLIWWDETHPVLRYVNFDYVYVQRGLALEAEQQVEKLIESNIGPALVYELHNGSHFLVLGFAVEESDFPKKIGFPVFIYNAIRWLGSGGEAERDEVRRPGDTLRANLPAGLSEARVRLPSGKTDTVRADNAGVARFAGTDQIGVYEFRAGEDVVERFAVNLEDATESDIVRPATLQIGADDKVKAGELIAAATPEIWRWFVGLALAIVMVEWWLYNRRVMA